MFMIIMPGYYFATKLQMSHIYDIFSPSLMHLKLYIFTLILVLRDGNSMMAAD